MRLLDGEAIYSASDLVGFAACEHLTQLELAGLIDPYSVPSIVDPLIRPQ